MSPIDFRGLSLAEAQPIIAAAAKRVAIQNVSRRGVLKGLTAAGAFVVSAQILPSAARAVETYPTGAVDMPHGAVNDPHVFVSIDPDGTVTIVAHRSEMGTGARTSLPMIVADEMEADWDRVKIVQAPGDEPTYGNQDTDGSRSVRHFIQPMRQIGAAMRQMLETAAAKEWGVPVEEVQADNHAVHHRASGRSLGYGDLAKAASTAPVPPVEDLVYKGPERYRYMGKGNVGIYDLHDITTGKAHYGSDTRLPGQLYAVVAYPPAYGGKVKSFDAAAAKQVPGVVEVVEIPGTPPPGIFNPMGGVAVVATNTFAALQGRDKLKIEWDAGPNAAYDSAAYRKQMEEMAGKPGTSIRNQGDPDGALAGAAKVVTAQYYAPHIAHAPMETPCATVMAMADKAEVWAPVQSPYTVRKDIAKLLGLDVEQVKVNVTLLGGGFGRKSKGDFVAEAAILSKAMGGKPVQVTWTREDDIQRGYFHTVSVERLDAGIDDKGKVVAFRHRSVAPSITSTFVADPKLPGSFEMGMGLVDNPFDIPNLREEVTVPPAHVRIGWFRSVSNIPHAFAVQSFVGELAAELGRDQKEMLLELIGPPRVIDNTAIGVSVEYWNYGDPYSVYPIDTGRLRGVVELAAERADWGKQLQSGDGKRRGMGIAAHRSFLTYVASVVEVEVDKDGTVRIPSVHTAIDCGFHVNPERIRSQYEGAAVMGMSLAMYGEVSFKNGRAEQSNFDAYKVARMDNFPVTQVHIVEHPFEVRASGAGEPGMPPFAPALCNAIYAATGQRIRDLPIIKHDLKEA